MTRLATVINKIIDIINTKQPALVSGENIKKLNGTDIVGSGNIPVKTVGGESILGDGNVGVKTINGETMIGSGDAEIVGTGTLSTTAQNIIGAINELDTDKAEQSDLTALTGRVGTAETDIVALDGRVTQAEAAVGTPLIASTVAGMTDITKIYVYTGSETGYTSGNWYYWNGTAWTSGGVYNSTAFETDTTLSVAGMAADAKATGDELTDVKSDIDVLNTNLIPVFADYYRYVNVDISDELQNGFYENGVYYANGSYRSIKHNCIVGERYEISTYLRLNNHWAIVYFYDSNDNLIAKYGGDADGTLTEDTYYENYEIVVPNRASYFVVSSYLMNNKPLKLMQWEEIDSDANYRNTSFRYLENLTIQNGVYDHGTFYPNESYQTTKVECSAGDIFKVDSYYYGSASHPVAQFYDSNMSLISTTTPITATGQLNDVEVVIPAGCSYVVFVNYIIADTVNFNIRKYINGEYPLFQKNYIALGDSITAIKDGWRPWFKKVTGANEILCTAVSGATLCDYDDTVVDGNPEALPHSNTISNQVQEILNDPPSENIDFIVISAGTNDHASAAEFDGGVTQFVDHNTNTYIDVDTVDRTRYDGAMRWAAEKLWSQFPSADIFWCTPIQGAEAVRQTWVQIRKCDYMKEVASHLACPVIDATRNSGIYGRYETNNTNGKYLIDGLHPNMYGRKKLGLLYASEIINYYSHEID